MSALSNTVMKSKKVKKKRKETRQFFELIEWRNISSISRGKWQQSETQWPGKNRKNRGGVI